MVFRARKSQQALCLRNPIHHRHSMSTAADLASSAVTAPMGIQQVNLFILIFMTLDMKRPSFAKVEQGAKLECKGV